MIQPPVKEAFFLPLRIFLLKSCKTAKNNEKNIKYL